MEAAFELCAESISFLDKIISACQIVRNVKRVLPDYPIDTLNFTVSSDVGKPRLAGHPSGYTALDPASLKNL